MKRSASFTEVPLTALTPEGWLRQYLVNQRNGLTGHLDECGFPFSTGGWAAGQVKHEQGADWWPYEQTGYWIDGMIRCGHLLRDDYLIGKARRHIKYVLSHPGTRGYLGPKFLQTGLRWPHAVFFRALMAEYSATGDKRIPQALRRHYLSKTSRNSDGREVCNVEEILWTFARTGDRRLLREAMRVYEEHCRLFPKSDTALQILLSDKRGTDHGVTYNEIGKLGAILYMYTGNRRYLAGAVNAYRKIDRFQMLIDGVCSSSEHLRGKDPLDTHETCDIADYTWSVGYLLMATGKAEYADKIERACFNAAPGAVRSDFKALQYFSGCNQVIATSTSNHSRFFRGRNWMSYRPNPDVQCCPGEVNRIMPNFAARMWMTDTEGDLVAVLYGPNRLTAQVGATRQDITIVEETGYPFTEQVVFQIRTAQPVEFALGLRIPGWCRKASVSVNGQVLKMRCRPGTFVKVRRQFMHNDRIVLDLPMEVKLSRWPKGGVGIERGPLVYALGVAEDWRPVQVKGRTTRDFPAWDLYPASAWNYALALDRDNPGKQVEVVRRPVAAHPWSLADAPLLLRVPARRVAGWKLEHHRKIRTAFWEGNKLAEQELKGDFTFTPPLPDRKTLRRRLGKRETITLVPYGCTRLRIAIFPRGA
jgi:uncharacterized protein